MTKIALLLIPTLMAFLPIATQAAQPAAPQPQMRTYVSGVGSDSNGCTASAPCKTFATALNLTIAGGQIFVLDSANYGSVTITKAVTITGEGAVAGILATSGMGITINAGANDVINLRGLDIDGGTTGSVGIQFNSGKSLTIQKSAIRNFASSGINFTPNGASTVFVLDTTLTNNRSNGLQISSSAPSVSGAVARVTTSGNGVGILANGSNVSVTLTDVLGGNNSYGIGATAAAMMVRNSTLNNNTVGIAADQNAVIRVDQSTITANGTGWQATNGGQVKSYGNNTVSGNSVDGTVSGTLALQ
jgi:hypothetical protein